MLKTIWKMLCPCLQKASDLDDEVEEIPLTETAYAKQGNSEIARVKMEPQEIASPAYQALMEWRFSRAYMLAQLTSGGRPEKVPAAKQETVCIVWLHEEGVEEEVPLPVLITFEVKLLRLHPGNTERPHLPHQGLLLEWHHARECFLAQLMSGRRSEEKALAAKQVTRDAAACAVSLSSPAPSSRTPARLTRRELRARRRRSRRRSACRRAATRRDSYKRQ